MDISVLVLCYHADLSKVYQTLYSILQQKNIEYEIVVSDDGSEYNHYDEIEEWFKKRKFYNYKFVDNKENQGTVRNMLSALEQAEGKYIKAISPGDFLYAENVLSDMVSYMKKENYKVCFGKSAYYSAEDEVHIYQKHNPKDMKVYRNYDFEKIKHNYFYFQDYVLGASFIMEKDTIGNYLNEIKDCVRYAEDISVLCMLTDDIQIGFWDHFFIWYEYGTGISTSGKDKWSEIIQNENKAVYKKCMQKDPNVKKAYAFLYEGKKNFVLELIRKMCRNPRFIAFVWDTVLLKKYKKESKGLKEEGLLQILDSGN